MSNSLSKMKAKRTKWVVVCAGYMMQEQTAGWYGACFVIELLALLDVCIIAQPKYKKKGKKKKDLKTKIQSACTLK